VNADNLEGLRRVLSATGYLPDGQPAPGLCIGSDAAPSQHRRRFIPDALWRSRAALTVYFKFEHEFPDELVISRWRREIWNEGFAPLLWVISPSRIDLYNGFGTPLNERDAQKHLIRTFSNIDAALRELDTLAGRLSMMTGQFWAEVPTVDRKTSVDQKLLSDVSFLERDLVDADLARSAAQALIGRVIFAQYLVDRGIVTATRLKRLCGHDALPPILRERNATERLFGWLSDNFNGDMFPPASVKTTPAARHLKRVAEFLEATDPESGQKSFFPYQFDLIPVELISSIYEQFAHAAPKSEARDAVSSGVHYTRLSLVSLVLDEVMNGLTGKESVLDLTCGSGVFLVEALRRLVQLKSRTEPLTRELIRAILYKQVFGVDVSEAAIRVAAFSLYLAALELDPDPQPPHALKFQPLIGKTLLVGDARTVEQAGHGAAALMMRNGVKKFDLIVGNPPWTFRGRAGTEARRKTQIAGTPVQPRGEGLDFVVRAAEFSHEQTRFGLILSAMPFFSRSATGIAAALNVMRLLAPVTLVNLSNLSGWLFATASMPAVVLFARHRSQPADQVTVVQIPWTADGARTQSFEISPTDIVSLSQTQIEERPFRLKVASVGRRRDLLLIDSLCSSHLALGTQLEHLGLAFADGLTRGKPTNQTRDARALKGLEILEAQDMHLFSVPEELDRFSLAKAQWPRARETYRAPLLIVKEMVAHNGRLAVAVSDRDLVYTDGYFGVSFAKFGHPLAHLLAAVLGSSFASWFFLMTSSEFGVWKRKLLIRDVSALPIPGLEQSLSTEAGKQLLRMEKLLRQSNPETYDLAALDDAVFELYDIGREEQIVIRDGLVRACWQWQSGRLNSVSAADVRSDITNYATIFLSAISGWLSARKQKHMRAEVFELRSRDPLRVVRFVLVDGPGDSRVDILTPQADLSQILDQIGKRLKVRLSTALSGMRELRIHGRHEVVIIKPSARRYWMGVAALEDADAVVAESFSGAAA
jgi:hypothetical protein